MLLIKYRRIKHGYGISWYANDNKVTLSLLLMLRHDPLILAIKKSIHTMTQFPSDSSFASHFLSRLNKKKFDSVVASSKINVQDAFILISH